MDAFNQMNYIDPKCPKCGVKVDYCVTTTFDEAKKAHRCNNCKSLLE